MTRYLKYYKNCVIRDRVTGTCFQAINPGKGFKWVDDLTEAYVFEDETEATSFLELVISKLALYQVNPSDLEVRQLEFLVQLKPKE